MIRDFKGVWIPAELWLDTTISPIQKFFLLEIDSLNHPKKGCYASNAHFSEMFGMAKTHCSRIIKQLEAADKITIDLQYDGKQIVKRTIRIVDRINNKQAEKLSTIHSQGVGANCPTPRSKMLKGYDKKRKGRDNSTSVKQKERDSSIHNPENHKKSQNQNPGTRGTTRAFDHFEPVELGDNDTGKVQTILNDLKGSRH